MVLFTIMKISLIICFCFFVFTFKAQTNRALFAGIDSYPEDSGWSKIHASNDLLLIKSMLKQSGYKNKNIKVLLNKKATKAGIVEELNKLAMQSKPDDYIYIHFSCHGQQMADDNGDEPDGLDESIIPYDAKRRFSSGKYEGKKHLRDDELDILLEKIRIRIGTKGNLTVVIDACHSGTGTRYGDDDEYIRGTTYIFAPDNYTPAIIDSSKLKMSLKKGEKLSPITVFSACHPEEVNYEYKLRSDKSVIYYGSLSYAFTKMFKTKDSNISNMEFSRLLENEMEIMFPKQKRKQTPYFESTDENKIFQIGR